MEVKHELIVLARCPVTGQVDEYECIVETTELIYVELILEVTGRYKNRAITQEELTQVLCTELEATVTTIGRHSGVKTTCLEMPS
jgi:hypothetical protein